MRIFQLPYKDTMRRLMSENCVKYCSLVGAHLVMAPLSLFWVYGNLSEYMESYFRFGCSSRCLDSNSEWILSVYIATICPGILLTKLMAGKMGLKWVGIVVALLGNAALFTSAWTIQVSVAWTTVLLGAVMGVVQGSTSVIVYETVNGWAPDKSIFMASTTSAATALSVLQNQMITAIVNPNNLKPDVNVGPKTYFSQPEILVRVPWALVCYAAITCGFQLVGYVLLVAPPETDGGSSGQSRDTTGQVEKGTNSADLSTPVSDAELNVNMSNSYGSNCKNNIITTPIDTLCMLTQGNSDDVNHQRPDPPPTQQRSVRPREAIKTPVFYVLYLFGIVTIYGQLLKGKYYKQFALLYIRNDRFLTLVGTLLPIMSTVFRIVLGVALDKDVLTIKDCVVLSLSLNGVLSFYWYLAPQPTHYGPTLYTLLVLGLAAAHTVYSAIIPTACFRVFGPAHFSTNYGIIYTSICIIGLLSVVIVTPIMNHLGWEWVFASSGLACLVTLVFAVSVDFDATKWLSD